MNPFNMFVDQWATYMVRRSNSNALEKFNLLKKENMLLLATSINEDSTNKWLNFLVNILLVNYHLQYYLLGELLVYL